MSNDAVTTLLDATRLTGLTATRSGALIGSLSRPNAAGTAYVSSLADLSGEEALPLTRGDASSSSPAVTTDGHVLFVSKRPGEDGSDAEAGSLWSLPARGEPRQLASRPAGFGTVATASDVVVAELEVHSRAQTEAEHATLWAQRTEAKVSAVLHREFPTRFWDHDLGPARQVLAVATLPQNLDALTQRPAPRAAKTDRAAGADADDVAAGESSASDEVTSLLDFSYARMPNGRLLNWDLADDGTFAVATVQVTRRDPLEAAQVWRIDLRGGEPTLLVDVDESGQTETIAGAISPDATRVLLERSQVWTAQKSPSSQLQVLDLASGTLHDVWAKGDRPFDPVWLDDTTLVAVSDDEGRGSVWIGAVDAETPERLAGGPEQKHSFSGLQVQGSADSASGVRLVASASAIDVAPFPVAVDPASGQVTALPNPADALDAPGELREVQAEAEDGTALRAWLRVPGGAGPHPLLVFAHGGPWGSWNGWTYRWNPNPFVEAGFAVLLPDPAISTGYGQAMIDRGQQQLGGTPFTDIMALTDAAAEASDIDANRQAFAGGSYGGYMANWVAGHTADRFRCIVTHASLWDTEEMGKTTDNSGWDAPMRVQNAEYSPHHYVDRIRVPMLVIHGDRDYRVPIAQGQHLWYDLLTSSATPPDADGATQHRYLFFPDEGHWILGRGNAEVWYRTFLAFLRRHVPGLAGGDGAGEDADAATPDWVARLG